MTNQHPRQKQILARARAGLAQKLTQDPVDWGYWETRWLDMGHAARESVAVREILPRLAEAYLNARPKYEKKPAHPEAIDDEPDMSAILAHFDAKTDIKTDTGKSEDALTYEYNNELSPEENRVIYECQKRLFWDRKNQNNG